MLGFDEESDDAGIVFRDLMQLGFLVFVMCAVLLIPHISPKATKASMTGDPPGNVIVEVTWPDDINADVDLWVEAPGDYPVGYSNKGGLVFNLLRDDLGSRADPLALNYETSYSRGIPPGEYTVNLHLYRNLSGVVPIPVTVVTSVKVSKEAKAVQVLSSKVELRHEGEELTVYRFKLDQNGSLESGSVHSVQRPLRSWRGAP